MARKSSSESKAPSSTFSPQRTLPSMESSSTLGPQRTSSRWPSAADKDSMLQKDLSMDIPLPVTYTPATHRISKAKKGKRVHACEYPGCNKVFTRAEHKRRHELNHNPEALFRCPHYGCKKAFHRPDLLTRHIERHEFEKRAEGLTEWKAHFQNSTSSNGSNMSGCMSVPPSADILFASSQSPASASTGPATDSTIRQDLPPEYPLLWSGMSMPLQNRETIPQYHVTEASEGGHFYPSPETCPSPTSDGASLLLSPHPPSSVPSATDTTIDPYPEDSMRANLTSSPLPLNSGLRCLEPSGLNIANMMPATQGGGFVQSDLQCPYPSPEWTATDSLPYGDYSPAMQWKAWSL